MPRQRAILGSFVLVTLCASAAAQQPPVEPLPTAEAIMARVAANQDQAEAERSHYVYVQHARVISRKGKTVMCEEVTDARVTPSATGSEQQMLKLQGRLLVKHQYIPYTALPPMKPDGEGMIEAHDSTLNISIGNDDTDRDLVENMRGNLTNDKSKDGIGSHLFPLTTKAQGDYLFHLVGREHRNGREVFHIEFSPKSKDDFGWKGNAFIDTAAYQPVVVTTTMSRKIPFAVRTLLGTSLPGLGFTVVYAPLPEGVWFPVSFGTEFKLKVLFFFSRQIIIDAQNKDFEKTHVKSTIVSSDEAPRTPLNSPYLNDGVNLVSEGYGQRLRCIAGSA